MTDSVMSNGVVDDAHGIRRTRLDSGLRVVTEHLPESADRARSPHLTRRANGLFLAVTHRNVWQARHTKRGAKLKFSMSRDIPPSR